MKRSTKCALQNCPNPAYRFGDTQHTLCRAHLQWANGVKRQGGVPLSDFLAQGKPQGYSAPRPAPRSHRASRHVMPFTPQFRAALARPRDREVRE